MEEFLKSFETNWDLVIKDHSRLSEKPYNFLILIDFYDHF